jgi:protein tyrosine phosphatase (PTP) superfamily phosphohydrolase (DUF442 family)
MSALAMAAEVPKWVGVSVVLVAVLGGVGIGAYLYFNRLYHYGVVQEGVLYRDGVRSMGEFGRALSRSKVRAVVSLVDAKEAGQEPFVSEVAKLREEGIEHVAIPVGLGRFPNTGDVRRFLAEVDGRKAKGERVLVHCAQGIRRTGMVVAAYQMSEMGWSRERAKAGILAFGHSQRTIGDIQRFIDVYDPKAREVTKDLGQSKE